MKIRLLILVSAWLTAVSFVAAMESLDKRLLSHDSAVRERAVREFQALPEDAQQRIVPSLMVALDADDPELRAHARRLLQGMGFSGEQTPKSQRVQMLDREAVQEEKKATFRSSRTEAYKEVQRAKKESFPDLRDEMEAEKKISSAYEASDLKNNPKTGGLDLLLDGLSDPDPWVRARSARKLGGVQPAPAQAVPKLIELLQDKDAEVRASAAGALGSMGDAARPALTALMQAAGDSDKGVRQVAADALRQIQPER